MTDTLNLNDWLVIVPARLASERLPRKPLADLGGKPMIVRVVENLSPLIKRGAKVVVATDSQEVLTAIQKYGIEGVMTSPTHPSGTDRTAEAASSRKEPYILNVQGDEPFIDTGSLIKLMEKVKSNSFIAMGTLVFASSDIEQAKDPNVVKAVRSHSGNAIYFSRSLVPYDRSNQAREHVPPTFWQHLGVYAFPREKLFQFLNLPPSPLEALEKLEQLRAIEAGWQIWLEPALKSSRGIDTPADLEAARAQF